MSELTFTPRELGGPMNPDLYDPGYSDDTGTNSQSTEIIQYDSLSPDIRLPLAKQTFDSEMQKSEQELRTFFDHVIPDLERTRNYCSQQRLRRRLDIRYDRNDRRAANRVKLRRDPVTGAVDLSYGDGPAELGLTQGFSAQAIAAGAGYQTNMYHERSERFFDFRPVGKKRENRKLRDGLIKYTEYRLRSGDFERHSRKRFFCNFKHGTTFLRRELSTEIKYAPGPDGVMVETMSDVKHNFRVWPIRDFEATNRERGDAVEQEGIFWITRQTNLSQLAPNEAVWDFNFDGQGQPLSMRRVSGKYFNLGCLRNLPPTSYEKTTEGSSDPNSFIKSRQDNKVSNFPCFDLIEYEGSISNGAANLFTPGIGRILGIDLGMGFDWDYEDAKLMQEFHDRAAAVKVWQISYMAQGGSRIAVRQNQAFQFNAAPFGRNSLYVYRYGDDENELDGLSISDYGDAIETFCDALRNAQVRVELFNSKPPIVVDKSALRETVKSEFRKLVMPDKIIEKQAGRQMKEFLELLYLQPNTSIEGTIQSLREMFFDVSGVLPIILGNASANTLGQDKMNRATAQNRLDDNLLWNAKEDYRMIRDMLEEDFKALGRDHFFSAMRSITGEEAIGIEEEISVVDQIWDQFFIDHPNSFGRDHTILSRMMDEKAMLYGPLGIPNMSRMFTVSLAAAGYPHAEDMLAAGWDILEPIEEQKQLAVGNNIQPSPQMDLLQLNDHISTHVATLQQIEAGQPIVFDTIVLPPKNTMALYQGLDRYLAKAVILRDMQLAQMMTSAGAMGGKGGMNGGGPMSGMQGSSQGMKGGIGKGDNSEETMLKNMTDSIGSSPMAGALPYIGGEK